MTLKTELLNILIIILIALVTKVNHSKQKRWSEKKLKYLFLTDMNISLIIFKITAQF